jgi:hypothetical protein
MAELEQVIRKHAIISPDELRYVDLADVLRGFEVERLSQGTFFRVFKVVGQPWVIKEGRWDIVISIHDKVGVPLHPQVTHRLSKHFSYTLLPTMDEIKRQYGEYLQLVEYLGYFEHSDDPFYANHTQICTNQRAIRESLAGLVPHIEQFYKFRLPEKIYAVLENEEICKYNFLPKEYTMVGPSISAENKGRDTIYIFQEFVDGITLHDSKRKRLSYEVKSQLILLVFLIFVMHYQIGLLPDTRPRYPVFELFDWFPKTDNIVLGTEGVRFVDTRSLWKTESNFIKRGAVIPELSINASKNYLNRLLASL